MTTNNVFDNTERERLADIESGWSIVEHRRKQKVLLIFGVKASTSLVEFKIACGDIGLNWLISREYVRRFGNHVRISVNSKVAKYCSREYVSRLSKLMRVSYGWRCVYDEICVGVNKVSEKCSSIKLINRYNVLQHEDSTEHGRALESVVTSPICGVGQS